MRAGESAPVRGDLASLLSVCRRAGLKATHQRIEILRELSGSTSHPDAETIHQRVRRRLPTLSLDTVYRTLNRLVETGAATRVPGCHNRARYEADTSPHHHFVCERCGRIADFTSAAFDRFTPPPEVRGLGRVDSVHIELRGRCRKCQSGLKKNKQEKPHEQ